MATSRQRQDDNRAPADDVRNASAISVATEDIARRAYEHYEERGRGPGHDLDDWLRAERELQKSRSLE
jgi:hypothetical protein